MKSILFKTLIVFITFFLTPFAWAGQKIPAHPEALVDSKWIIEHADDENVVLLDGSDKKDDTYVNKTVKGALCLSYRELRKPSGMMKGVTYGMEEETFDKSPLEEIFRQAGVNRESTVVVVGQHRIDDAALVFWTLKWLGHKDVRLLPVNYLEVLPQERLSSELKDLSDVDREGNFQVQADWTWYATREDTVWAMQSPETGIWDVRSRSYFQGNKTKTIRGGTLATAKNWFFKKAWTNDSMGKLDWDSVASNLKKRFGRADRQETTVISFCNSGHIGSIGFLAWQCGFDWALCDSSWNMLAYDGSLPVKNIQFHIKP